MKMAEILQELGWSQGYFASQAGLSPGTVSGWRKSGRCPSLALAYLEAELRLKRIIDLASPGVVRPKGRPRGVPIHLQGGPRGGEVWERSATDAGSQVPDGDYRKRLDSWEEADMNQDGGEYGRG